MVKVKLTNGEIVEVDNNTAHTLIESGKAKLYKPSQDKMMRPSGNKKKYVTK